MDHALAWKTWLVAVLATLAATAVVLLVVGSFVDDPVSGRSDTRLALFAICVGLVTFVCFAIVPSRTTARLVDKAMANTLLVAGIHVAVTSVVFLVDLVGRLVTGGDAPPIFDGTIAEEIGRGLTLLVVSWIGATAGCITSLGLVTDQDSARRPTR